MELQTVTTNVQLCLIYISGMFKRLDHDKKFIKD